MGRGGQESNCNPAEAKVRLRDAKEYLELAQLKADEASLAARKAAAGNAVLAGIAAADTICCVRLGKRSSSTTHNDAVMMLELVDRPLARSLALLVALKTPAQYGTSLLSSADVTRAMRAADDLVDAAERIVAGA